MKLENKRSYLGEKGITLIALVVTIVVLLILAGVSVNAIFNENGLIKKAQEAQSKMDEAQKSDLDAINSLNEWVDSKVNETPTTPVISPETWILNATISMPAEDVEWNIKFTSNNEQFTKIKVSTKGNVYYNEIKAGMTGPTAGDIESIPMLLSYRTVTFETAPTGELLAWLQENATKQEQSDIKAD